MIEIHLRKMIVHRPNNHFSIIHEVDTTTPHSTLKKLRTSR